MAVRINVQTGNLPRMDRQKIIAVIFAFFMVSSMIAFGATVL